jgi:hypothetical protein
MKPAGFAAQSGQHSPSIDSAESQAMNPSSPVLRGRALSLALLGLFAAQTLANPAAPAASASRAEDSAWPGLRVELSQVLNLATQLGEDTMQWVSRELGQGRIIKGAPYCADAVHESIQVLADGNRIVNRHTTRLCRDGEGRTRQEVSARDGRKTIYLRDPVAGETWILDPERKTARRSMATFSARLDGHDSALSFDSSAWREHADKLREWARQMADRAREMTRAQPGAVAPVAPVPPTPPAPPGSPTPGASAKPRHAPSAPEPVVVTRNEWSDAQGQVRDVEVQVMRLPPRESAAPAPMPGLAAFDASLPPPAVGLNAWRFAPRGPGVVTALPAREIEGVRVHGERTTWTIEEGKLGNEKPIVIAREVWSSPELILTIMSRDSDPRSGEVNYRLQNLKRGEPDAALMKVPADYETKGRPQPRTPPASAARG